MATSTESAPTVTLFRGFPGAGVYTWSPFVTKLEARLRFSNIAYRAEAGSISKAPRGKLPYISIEHPDGQSETMSDSTLITKGFIESGHAADLNQKLSPTERLQDLGLKALLEDQLYFYQGHERWVLNYYTMRDQILGSLPWPMQVIVGNIIYNKNVRTLHGQGTLRFSTEEIADSRAEVWATLNGHVAAVHARHQDREGPFWVWGGVAPTEADASLYGFIVSGLVCAAGPATNEIIRSYPALLAYARRIHDAYFPEYQLWE
ncbi:uncharacterized protein N7459_007980 [Penicillium hispanicum]|uniref:uncharacterized protein n=1 Tax=Penicillium hispanicum TaxID=1080232 RepID=UPI0025409CA3|nr:uncharacterized protein N7459_007980 [Penicillium hispanicum]KAJ5573553.1 hypothetical protein N7459_007980 [Penicillium hispanicum]